jgi:hypothetical protein
VHDHTAAWQRLRRVADVNGDANAALEAFCERKRITLAALEQLDARIVNRGDIGWCIAYAGRSGNGAVTAIKYWPLNGTSHDSFAESRSVWLRPIVIGDLRSLDWLIAEGETDAARLYGLVGDRCAILALPAGARTFKLEWASAIPRGATVALCHDADAEGDAGAEKAARIIGGRTVRVRPPVDGSDWCDWDGDRDAFLQLARPIPRFEFARYADFAARELPVAEPLLGEPGKILLATGSLLMLYGPDGSGKSTWTIDGIAHLAAGVDWLGIPVSRPVRICVIENDGPPSLFQRKLRDKFAGWAGPDPAPNLFVYPNPWAEFSFADPDARAALREHCDEHRVELVVANSTLGLGVGTSGRPDEPEQFVDWLTECGLWRDRAFWLLHHENKAGQISGDWGRHPDTKVCLQRDGNRPRTKLDCAKTRWATLEPTEKAVILEWLVDTQGYTVIELETAAASDDELDERIAEYLMNHPASSTTSVCGGVTGTNSRIRARLDAKFDCVNGARGAKLWVPPSSPTPTCADGVDGVA